MGIKRIQGWEGIDIDQCSNFRLKLQPLVLIRRNVPKRFRVYQQKGDMFAEPWLSYLGPKNTPLQNHFIHLAKWVYNLSAVVYNAETATGILYKNH